MYLALVYAFFIVINTHCMESPIEDSFQKQFPEQYKNIESFNLNTQELTSLYHYTNEYEKDQKKNFLNEEHGLDNAKDRNRLSLLQWLFKKNINRLSENAKNYYKDCPINNGYFWFDGLNKLKTFNLMPFIRFTISMPLFFNGKQAQFFNQSGNYDGLDILHYDHQEKELCLKVLSLAKATYKIHLMPSEESFYPTLYTLFEILEKNPKVSYSFHLRDLINNIKVRTRPYQSKKDALPTVVIYIPTIFIDNQDAQQLTEDQLLEHFNKYVDYKKSKECLITLLKFLIKFFNDNPDCKGSNVIPRYNAQVTDMIFFTQGNGDDKKKLKQYFEEKDLIYFKAEEGEDFKVDIDTLKKECLEEQSKHKKTNPVPDTVEDISEAIQQDKSKLINDKKPEQKIQNKKAQSDQKSTPTNKNNSTISLWQSFKNIIVNAFFTFFYFVIRVF